MKKKKKKKKKNQTPGKKFCERLNLKAVEEDWLGGFKRNLGQ